MTKTKERLIPVPNPERELEDSEMRGAFASVQQDSPIWLAVLQVIRDHYTYTIANTGHPETSKDHGSLAHSAGGQEAISLLYAELSDRFAEAHELGGTPPPLMGEG